MNTTESQTSNEKKMLEEKKPEAIASPEQNHEDCSNKKKKNKKKKNKNNENSPQPNQESQVSSEPLLVTQNPELKSIDSTIPLNTHSENQNSHKKTLIELEQKYLKKKRKIERKMEREKKINEQNDKPLEETIVQKPKDPITEPSIDSTMVMNPNPAIATSPIDEEPKIAKKDKKRKRKGVIKNEGEEKSNEDNGKPNETPVQESINPSTPTDEEQKIAKKHKKKRKGVLKTEGEVKPNEENGELNETPVQKPTCPVTEPSIKPATPIDAKQNIAKNNNNKGKHNGVSKSGGLISNRHNAGSTAETSVQGFNGVTVPKAPYNQHRANSMICWACRQPYHTIEQCFKLKRLSKNDEICFFCGEIGHSLGRCSVYKAGGGRFARCLFCHAQGHFSYNCPGNGHYPKVAEGLPGAYPGMSNIDALTLTNQSLVAGGQAVPSGS